MNQSTAFSSKNLIKTSTVILLAFATVFFPRLLDSAGAPSTVNFLHFATIPFALAVALVKSRPKDRQQILIVKELLFGLCLLLTVVLASALWNGAGFINVVFSFLLLAEPFMLLIMIVCLPISPARLEWIQKWMAGFVFFHLFLIYVQYGLGFCHLPGDCDNIQGVFYRSGSGHVVGASVSCSFSVYYFVTAKTKPLWLRVLVLVTGFLNIQLADAKQVLFIFVLAFIILTLINLVLFNLDIGKFFLYLIGIIIFITLFVWAVQNIPALGAFATWARPEIYGPDGEATKVKFLGIRTIISYFHSPVNWLLGLGPGHTVSRMGGWMLRDYSSLLSPLGATRVPLGETVPVSTIVWQDLASSWLAQGSSFFAPFWSWAGLWGDFGFLGLLAYIYVCSIVWRRLCWTDLPKFLMLTVFVCGFIFTQMEEPAYMMYIASLIGLHWQEYQIHKHILNELHSYPSGR